jgi:ABC-type glutathione transport system ATPase component
MISKFISSLLGEYGIALSWNFPFSIYYWKSNSNKSISLKRKSSSSSIESYEDEDEDEDENGNKLIVQIESLTKYFPQTNRIVVNNLSFNLYENQITALLGQNGAGNVN